MASMLRRAAVQRSENILYLVLLYVLQQHSVLSAWN